jgi:hypothetical protein
MAEWNHARCAACWKRDNPDRTPVRVRNADPTVCCSCGRVTVSGIYVRNNPDDEAHPRGHGR